MKLHTLILAAGAGRRFGGGLKQLALINGHPLLARCVIAAEAVTPGQVSVVLGYEHQRLTPWITPARVVLNPEWARGLGHSIACGVKALPANVDAVLLVLADQAALTAKDFGLLWERYRALISDADSLALNHDQALDTSPLVCAEYADGLGVPAIFPRRLFAPLMALDGDSGAKNLLLVHAAIGVPLARAAIDIDTQQQWRDFSRQLS